MYSEEWAPESRGKEVEQGEHTTDNLAPDTEPGMRVTGFGARTTSCKKG
jgi:hypothetical protein